MSRGQTEIDQVRVLLESERRSGARQHEIINALRAENAKLRNQQATLEHTNQWQGHEIERLTEKLRHWNAMDLGRRDAIAERDTEIERLAASLTAWKDRALQAESLMDQSLETRIERLELIVMLLCDKASRGEGSMGKPFWEFAETIKRELVEPLGHSNCQ